MTSSNPETKSQHYFIILWSLLVQSHEWASGCIMSQERVEFGGDSHPQQSKDSGRAWVSKIWTVFRADKKTLELASSVSSTSCVILG